MSAAIFLRVYAMDRLPPGLFGDEAVEGLDALDVLAGNFALWFHAHLGREPLYVYLVALSYGAFGVTPLATRLPALVAGLLTLPAAFFFVREWALHIFSRERATRLALLTTALLAISFWHIQMSRDAHRATLLPLVEAVGYGLLWRALRTREWRTYAGAGAMLGLALYTYSPGRFVGLLVGVFVVVEFVVSAFARKQCAEARTTNAFDWRGLVGAALAALLVMLPLGIYFAQNPAQFTRRFASVSVFDADEPLAALGESVAGNLAQFVIPGAGYQSRHYNLPGKPIFDLLLAPWFLAGIAIAIARLWQPAYRFLLLWFVVMMVPAFLTADMIPKGVRALGVAPGVFAFPALAMLEFVIRNSIVRTSLVALCIIGSTIWTAYDYFVAWARLPELPLKFDADMVEVAGFIQQQPAHQPIYISSEVYRHPTLMLLGKRVPTTRYFDRATRYREFDARTTFVSGANEANALYVFVGEYMPPEEWLTRLAPQAVRVVQGEYFAVYRLGALAPPQQALEVSFNPLLKLVGVSRYPPRSPRAQGDEPRGIALYWQVTALPADRAEMQATLSLSDPRGALVTQDKHRFGVPPMEWALGDTFVEWYTLEIPEHAAQFSLQLARGAGMWQSPVLALK